MKDVVGLTSIVQAKHGRSLQNYLHCSVFQFCTIYSLLSLSYHLLTVISLVINLLANYKQVSASKAINVIEHNDCLLSPSYHTTKYQYTDQILVTSSPSSPPPPNNMIDFTTKITTTFYPSILLFLFRIFLLR